MPDATKHLECDEITKRFGSIDVVRNVSFSVAEGEFLTLLGPSGSGKTTLLRVLGGFEYPTSGRILLHGEDIGGLPPYRRSIGMVFQKYALFPHLTIFENIAYPLRRRGIGKPSVRSRVHDALDMVGLRDFASRYPKQLSGGQQQRVALARAVVFHPAMLLMDEPLGALDKQLRERMQREIRALQLRLGITAVYVTHDQTEAMTMSDRIAVMNHGKIEQIGKPQDLYEHPETEFVARFVGDSNLIPVSAAAPADGRIALTTKSGARLFCPSKARAAERKEAMLLVRPEKIGLQAAGVAASGDGHNVLRGKVSAVIFMGESTCIDVAVEGQILSVKRQNREGIGPLNVGDDVTLEWFVADCFLVG